MAGRQFETKLTSTPPSGECVVVKCMFRLTDCVIAGMMVLGITVYFVSLGR